MRKVVSFLVVALCACQMMATVVLNADFTKSQGAWTISDEDLGGLTYVWQQTASYGMKASAYTKQANVAESWFISPAFDLSDATEASLAINHALNKGNHSTLAVCAKATGDENWTDLTVVDWPAGNSWTFQDATADLSGFAGKSGVQIAFKYVSTTANCPTWEIKTAKVTSDGSGEDVPTPSVEVMTCEQAAAAAKGGSTASVTVRGYVTSIAHPLKDGSMSFWMADTKDGGNVFEAYKCTIDDPEDAVLVGDLVEASGTLAYYKTTAELAAGCAVKIIERGEPIEPKNLGEMTIEEFLSLKNTMDTCVLTGVVANIVMDKSDDTQYNKYGNFDLVELDNDQVYVYVYGLLTADGVSGKFREMGVDEGDTLTIKAVYTVYKSNPQAQNAVFVSVIDGEGGGPTGDYSYEWEPTTVTTVSINADAIQIEDYSAEYGAVVISLTDNTQLNTFVQLEFITSTYNPEAGIPAGTYQISDSEAEGTFWASPGGDEDEDYGCYIGVPDPDDPEEYYIPYYMISGTVTISANGSIAVNATSYYGSTLIITYTAKEQGIEHTAVKSANTHKALRNGMLLIEKNGVRYNAVGQIVK